MIQFAGGMVDNVLPNPSRHEVRNAAAGTATGDHTSHNNCAVTTVLVLMMPNTGLESKKKQKKTLALQFW